MHETPHNTALVFHRVPRRQHQIDALRNVLCTESGVAQPSAVYGFYGRMAKITPAYMAIVEEILKCDPRAIFFAGGTGPVSMILDRKQASSAGDRMIIYNDSVDGHIVSECIDIFLDTFPFPGGNSCLEVQAHGVPVVWMQPAPDSEMQLVLTLRDERLKARDGAHFVELSLQLAKSDKRVEHGEFAQELAIQHGDMIEQAAIVEHHLRAVWNQTVR